MKANKLKKGGKGVFRFGKGPVVLFIGAVVGLIGIGFSYHVFHMKPPCPIRQVEFTDNKRLTSEELRELAGVPMRKSLLTVSCSEIGRHMLKSPWIKSATVRKEFPGTLSIRIQETQPFALLDMHEHLFLIDDRGKMLEELKGDAELFLPVIVSDPYKEKEGFNEALQLIRLLNEKGLTAGRDHIEVIAHKPHELSVELDEAVVKIGAGEYDEKIERLMQLEADLRERNILVDSIDLRFGNKAIVKPITVQRVEE